MRGQAFVFEHPAFSIIDGFEDAAAEPRHIENARASRTCPVEQDVRGSRFRHPLVRELPRAPAVFAPEHTADVTVRIPTMPHLRAWEIVRAAHHGPRAAPNLWIKNHPVCGIHPTPQYGFGRADPAAAAILTTEQADVGIRDK